MKKKPAPEPKPPAISIREIRGERVLLDADLAAIYGVATRVLNQAVRRNAERFPEDFWFQLTEQERDSLKSQNAISSLEADPKEQRADLRSQNATASAGVDRMRSQIVTGSPEAEGMRSQSVIASKRNVRHLPYAFTEHGALQAANILRSPRAVAMSVFVIRAFVQMRATLLGNSALAAKLAELEARLTGRLDTQEHAIVHVMQQLVKLLASPSQPPPPPKPKIGFKQ